MELNLRNDIFIILEKLQKDKLRWRDTARTDSFSLTLDEFFAFRHPGM